MTADNRREDIANYVISRGDVRIDELVSTFGVSRMTIHRHVEALSRQGVLRKLHGAVSAQPSGVYESLFRYRVTVAQERKRALAKAALTMIEPGEVVLLDDSTTAHALAPMLPEAAPLTVITNSLASIMALTEADELGLIALGGDYHPTYNAFIGHVCERALSGLRANVLVCSASAISGHSALIQDPQVVRIKQAMMAAASRRILLADSTKFGRIALHHFAELDEFDAVICDAGLSAGTARAIEAAGVKLRLVPTA